MARSPHPLPNTLGSTFTATEARLAGVDAKRLKQSDVARLAHNVYCRSQVITVSKSPSVPGGVAPHPHEIWRRTQSVRATALAPLIGIGRFFSHHTAAALWELPITPPYDSSGLLDIASFKESRGRSSAGLRGRVLSSHLTGITTLRGIPLTDPATTWAQLAPGLERDDAVALGDAAIHMPRIGGTDRLERPPLAIIDELALAAHAPHRRGGRKLRTILPLLSPHAASPPESHLRLQLVAWGVPKPELDYDVRDTHGATIGTSEIAFPEFKLAMEYEGVHHFTSAQQSARDIEKYRRYTENGWEVLRVTGWLLYRNRPELRRQTFETLARRGWRP